MAAATRQETRPAVLPNSVVLPCPPLTDTEPEPPSNVSCRRRRWRSRRRRRRRTHPAAAGGRVPAASVDEVVPVPVLKTCEARPPWRYAVTLEPPPSTVSLPAISKSEVKPLGSVVSVAGAPITNDEFVEHPVRERSPHRYNSTRLTVVQRCAETCESLFGDACARPVYDRDVEPPTIVTTSTILRPSDAFSLNML